MHAFPFLRLLVIALVLASAGGCVSPRTLGLAPGQAASLGHDPDGTPVLRSQKTHAVAVRPLTEKFGGEAASLPAFSILVTNRGTAAVTLSAPDVQVFSGERKVAVLDRPALMGRLLREARTPQSISVRSSIPDSSQPASRPIGSTSSASVTVLGAPDPQALRDAGPQLSQMLVHAIITPGRTGGGIVKLDNDAITTGAPLRLVVVVAGEPHEFRFTVTR